MSKSEKWFIYPREVKESWKKLYQEFDKEIYNIGIVASFGNMIPSKLIDKFQKGCYVMHPSLLPKYRGACPIQYALLNKDKKTGVSIIEASKKSYDKGHLLKQIEIDIKEEYRFKELSEILSRKGGEELINFLKDFDDLVRNKKEQSIDPNDKSQTAPLITERNYVYLEFSNKSSEEILTLYNAFFGSQLEPYTKIIFQGNERQLFFNDLTHASSSQVETLRSIENLAKSGGLYWDMKVDKNSFYIKTTNGWLVSMVIKIDKKNYMPTEQFITEILKNQRFNKKKDGLAFITLPK